jgi:hypothetical protein
MDRLQLALAIWSFGIGWLIGIFMGQISILKEALDKMKEEINRNFGSK